MLTKRYLNCTITVSEFLIVKAMIKIYTYYGIEIGVVRSYDNTVNYSAPNSRERQLKRKPEAHLFAENLISYTIVLIQSKTTPRCQIVKRLLINLIQFWE